MQLNITTDYAVRIILMLSGLKRYAPASEIAKTLAIPANYLMKVLAKLKAAGLVASALGVNGGFYLDRPAEGITFEMVFEAMGDSVKINRCLEADHYCSRDAVESCPVRSFYTKIQTYLDDQFAHTTIVGLSKEEKNSAGKGIEKTKLSAD